MSLIGALTLGMSNGFRGGDFPWPLRVVRACLPSRWACGLGLHAWRISSVNLSGHQSSRSRRCDECFDRGRLLIETQSRGYYGEPDGSSWVVETDKRGSIIDGRFVEAGRLGIAHVVR